jgi:hypothetical protein
MKLDALQNWKKLGRFIETGKNVKGVDIVHSMDPSVCQVKDDIFRAYFSNRNGNNQSVIYSTDMSLLSPIETANFNPNPVLEPGELGAFDDNGVTASCVVKHDGFWYLYYIGWKPRSTTRFGLMTGLAISDNEGRTFKRYSRAPILNLTNDEPFSILTAPFVLKSNLGWMMWYVSCTGWVEPDLPMYNIKYATSNDGLKWEQPGTVCLDYKDEDEVALARPCVYFANGVFNMWFSYKSLTDGYNIGFATSPDGIKWDRKDSLIGISRSDSGWDSEMIEYPYVVPYNNDLFMFYNGNRYGETGAGIAVLKG